MDKKEYISIRLKKDFLQYSLLQEDSLTAKVIADKLYHEINVADYILACKNKISKLTNEYLSFDEMKINGKLTNELPATMKLELKDKIVILFQEFLKQTDIDSLTQNIVNQIVHHIERLTWDNGITEMGTAIQLMLHKVSTAAKSYEYIQSTAINETELIEKYDKAKENSILERLQGNNIDDIIEYRNALSEYVKIKCENLIYESIQQLLNKVKEDDIFIQLQANFTQLECYATELKNSLPKEWTHNSSWDATYDKLVPTNFYYRNVESITAEQAFHMVLLQHLASNEDWMKERNMLQDGELRVYTDPQGHHLSELLKKLEETL